ncbi:MAG: integrase arm-type DNA-binding domain-containing protein [Proteobacteria bacterium]|nr:integrase arm-type DNA-binding domain-containing protein [Pseudomonadota bacterium]
MAAILKKLTAKQIQTLPAGLHADGGNLYLRVRPAGSRQWVMIYKSAGKQRELGLGGAGPYGLSLADARGKADEVRTDLLKGVDPIDRREQEANVTTIPTFGDFADAYIAKVRPGWKNAKHAAQWEMTMTVYAAPIRGKQVNAITTQDIVQILNPIWTTKNETATRVRGRIETILNAARVAGHIGDNIANPARLKGHIELLMPKVGKLQRGHFAAMHYEDIPAFMVALGKRDAVAALLLEFTILTVARSSMSRLATWGEIRTVPKASTSVNTSTEPATPDQSAEVDWVWSIPAKRMKGDNAFEVPLAPRAVEILKRVAELRLSDDPDQMIFPGQRRGKPLSDGALEMLLRRMGRGDCTPHGFRSSFRDWCGDETETPREVAEHNLSHTIGNKAEQAYRRMKALKKRRAVLEAWEAYCLSVRNAK